MIIQFSEPEPRPSPDLYSQAWDRLISGQFATHERPPLLATLYSGDGGIEIARRLSAWGNNEAQVFIDVIDEGGLRAFRVRRRTGWLIVFKPLFFVN